MFAVEKLLLLGRRSCKVSTLESIECDDTSEEGRASGRMFTREQDLLLMRDRVLMSAFAATYGEKGKVCEKVEELCHRNRRYWVVERRSTGLRWCSMHLAEVDMQSVRATSA